MYCPDCGAPRDASSDPCPGCGAPAPGQSTRAAPVYVNTGDSGLQHLIPTKNVPALLAYYFGVFSLIPCLALGLGPAAIILGRKGFQKSRVLPGNIGKGHAITGIILGGITTLLNFGALAIILLSSRH